MRRYYKILILSKIFILSLCLADYYIPTTLKISYCFKEFNCVYSKTSYKSKGYYSCYINATNGEKIFLPNQVSFKENFKQNDKFNILKTAIFHSDKQLEFIFENKLSIEKISFFDFNFMKVIFVLIILFFSIIFFNNGNNDYLEALLGFLFVISTSLLLVFFLCF